MDRSKPNLGPGSSLDDVMAHFGVRGMRWGVRRKSGGSSHPETEDAKKTAVSTAKVKSSGTKSLSTKDLQDLVTRMNLEQQYSRLSTQNKKENPGIKFAKELLINVGKQQATSIASGLAAKQIAKVLAGK